MFTACRRFFVCEKAVMIVRKRAKEEEPRKGGGETSGEIAAMKGEGN